MGVNSHNSALYALIFLSVVLALLLAIYPLAPMYSLLRPEFLCLLVIYWVLQAPSYAGVIFAWAMGLLQDLLEGGTWGGHALALVLVAYFCMAAHQRMKNYSVLHQSLWVFVLVGLHQVIVNWVQGLAGYAALPTALILSAAVSALLWPLLRLGLDRLRRNYRLL